MQITKFGATFTMDNSAYQGIVQESGKAEADRIKGLAAQRVANELGDTDVDITVDRADSTQFIGKRLTKHNDVAWITHPTDDPNVQYGGIPREGTWEQFIDKIVKVSKIVAARVKGE